MLDLLVREEWALPLFVLGVAPAARAWLEQTSEVSDIREALRSGTLTEPEIEQFTRKLLADFQLGRRFANEPALAAIAVALESRSTPFAQEFVRDLSALRLAEMPLAIRVAREVLERKKASAGVVQQVIFVSDPSVGSVRFGAAPWGNKARGITAQDFGTRVSPRNSASTNSTVCEVA